MAVVVIIGFSCAGKSWLLQQLRARATNPNDELRQLNVLFLDSDEEIAQDFENDTRRIFIDQVSGLNRDTALSTVITRETRFLTREHVDPAVIALGPGALNRDGIGNFLARPNTFIVRITIADGVANSRLLRRHNEGPADIVDHVNYGSWDFRNLYNLMGPGIFSIKSLGNEKMRLNEETMVSAVGPTRYW